VLRFSANISVLFRELPLPARFAAARACGFAAVEIQVPYELTAAQLAEAARAADVAVVLINAPLGPDGAPGIACRSEHRQLFRSGLERAAEYAAAVKAPCVNVLAGRTTAAERTQSIAQLCEHLSLAAEILAAAGARPLLEPINPHDVPDYCVPSFALGADVLTQCDARVGLQYDVYHAARLGLDPQQTFIAMQARIAHIQFADVPGRHEPGTGELPFAHIFDTIARSDFAGWTGAEYHPSGSTPNSLGWLQSAHDGL
jgi:hydroxypyruvate isomerase